jgi:hypothetical protein
MTKMARPLAAIEAYHAKIGEDARPTGRGEDRQREKESRFDRFSHVFLWRRQKQLR